VLRVSGGTSSWGPSPRALSRPAAVQRCGHFARIALSPPGRLTSRFQATTPRRSVREPGQAQRDGVTREAHLAHSLAAGGRAEPFAGVREGSSAKKPQAAPRIDPLPASNRPDRSHTTVTACGGTSVQGGRPQASLSPGAGRAGDQNSPARVLPSGAAAGATHSEPSSWRARNQADDPLLAHRGRLIRPLAKAGNSRAAGSRSAHLQVLVRPSRAGARSGPLSSRAQEQVDQLVGVAGARAAFRPTRVPARR